MLVNFGSRKLIFTNYMYGKSVLFRCSVVSICSVRYSSKSTKKLLEFLGDMPKYNSSRIADAQRQRQKISKKSEKYGPSTAYLQVLGSGARGAPATLYLFTDQKRYLFNCGECTQRLAHEHKVKLSRLEHIFITNKTWRNIGGLPGLSLTLQDVGIPNITLHGPEGLDELYSATERFVIMKDMKVNMAKCSPSEDYEDGVMTVKYVLLGPHESILNKDPKPAKKPKLGDSATDKEFEEFIHDDTDYYRSEGRNTENNKNKQSKEKKQPSPKSSSEKDPMKRKTEKVLHDLQKKTHCSVAYICTLRKRLGTLDLTKCVEMGVKPGPLLGKLKNGHDVVLPDGTLVLSKDVKSPDEPGPVFIVLDVPDISYLKAAEFSAHFDNGENPSDNIPSLIVHFTPPHVFHHPTYKAFLSMFGPTTRHLILNGQNSCLGSEAVHRTQHKLHLLDPDIFPLLKDVSVPAVWNAQPPLPKTNSPVRLKGLEELKNKIALAQFQNIINMEGSCKGDGHQTNAEDPEVGNKLELIAGRTLTQFHLRPKKQLDRTSEPKLHIQDYIQETMDVDGFAASLDHFRRLVESMRYARSEAQREYPKVVFLGTGSCIPSKTRNTSAIVLHVDENHSMLLDCGEGTFNQLVRFYGPKRVNSFLRTLKAIYISHLHADHHIGLIGVLQARHQAFEEVEDSQPYEPVLLLAPGQIVSWLSLFDQQFEKIHSYFKLKPNQGMMNEDATGLSPAELCSMGLSRVRTCHVPHCPNAFGVALELDNRHKITYSGDTRPSDELVRIGENSTLLIHEATMEDDLLDEAKMKMHSTTSEAIDIGRQMNARYTVLTHFSQRYARLPRLNAHILNDNNSVAIAFDNMQITMTDLELLPHMYAPLQLMFAEHCVEMELKANYRALVKERRLSASSQQSSDKSSSVLHASAGSVRKRKLSPAGCRGVFSAPPGSPTHALYRESHASRLRQEMKGMTVTGVVRPPRSKSSSPNKRCRQARSGSATPQREHSLDKPIDLIAPPRTMSETSNLSKDGQEKFKPPSTASSGYIVDTRSKTLNTVYHPVEPSESAASSVKPSRTSTNTFAPQEPNPASSAGYGKPLVTPVNKKLTIRRELPPPDFTRLASNAEKTSPNVASAKSSAKSWKAENRRPTPSPSAKNADITTHKLPTKGTLSSNKLPASNAMKSDTKIPMLRLPGTVKSLRGSTSSLNRPNRSPTRQVKSDIKPQDIKTAATNRFKSIRPPCRRDGNSPSSESSNSSPVRSSPQRPSKLPTKISPPPLYRRPIVKTENKPPSPEPVKKSSDMLCESILKQSFCKDIKPIHIIGRPNSGIHSNKSFKPQLEDIKSSYLLLNKKAQEKNAKDEKCLSNGKKKVMSNIPKPKPLDESQRRELLKEAKERFQSKRFWNDSKYDKIEGLNWISWK